MRLLITPPFDSPIAPKMLSADELASILAEHSVDVTDDPKRADIELVGGTQLWSGPEHCRLSRERVVLIDGEPPQPEYLLPHYFVPIGFAAVLTPANLAVYSDCFAYYEPPPSKMPEFDGRRGMCQLATYREMPGNANGGTHLLVTPGGEPWCWRVLCNERADVGRRLHGKEGFDLYGRGWERVGVDVVDNSRNSSDFLERRHKIARCYRFDLNWENMEIPRYATEKFWSALYAGALPVYWGPPDMHAQLPPETIVDARCYDRGDSYDLDGLVQELQSFFDDEWRGRAEDLQYWYRDLPRDIAHRSWVKAAHMLGRSLNLAMDRVESKK